MVRNRGLYSCYGRWQSEEDERVENFGLLRGEAEELACQGGKPWDDDAWVSSVELLFFVVVNDMSLSGCNGRHLIRILSITGPHGMH